jgi:hypothetical protein
MAEPPSNGTVNFEALAHHATYGQPGAPSPHRVVPEWELAPFTSTTQTSPWNIALTSTQLSNLVNGFMPQQMEDKWLICSQGEVKEGEVVTVEFYRSWTGRKIWALEIVVGKEGEGSVKALTWEESEEAVREQDFEAAKEGVSEVCRWVLEVELGSDE